MPEVDALRLLEFGKEIAGRFSNPIPSELKRKDNYVTIILEKEQLVNHLILAEDLTEGEGIEEFMIWLKSERIQEPVCLYIGKTVGYKRIITFPTIAAKELIIEVTKGDKVFSLKQARAFYITK